MVHVDKVGTDLPKNLASTKKSDRAGFSHTCLGTVKLGGARAN